MGYTAVLCPVCQGKGTICNHDANMPLFLHPTCPTCHGCGGRGWVEVHNGIPDNYVYPNGTLFYEPQPEYKIPETTG